MKEERIRARNHSEVAKRYDELFADQELHFAFDPEEYGHRKHSLFLLNLLDVPFDPNKKLLDVACGAGGFLYYAERRLSCSGIDISRVAIEYAKKLLKSGKVEVGKAEALPYPDNEFDFVTCLGSLEHFLDQARALQEMRRVLKEDGRMLIEVPNLYALSLIVWAWLTGGEPLGKRGGQPIEQADTIRGWQQLIEGNGFKVIKVAIYNWRTHPLELIHIELSLRGLLRLLIRLTSFLIPRNLSENFVYIVRKPN